MMRVLTNSTICTRTIDEDRAWTINLWSIWLSGSLIRMGQTIRTFFCPTILSQASVCSYSCPYWLESWGHRRPWCSFALQLCKAFLETGETMQTYKWPFTHYLDLDAQGDIWEWPLPSLSGQVSLSRCGSPVPGICNLELDEPLRASQWMRMKLEKWSDVNAWIAHNMTEVLGPMFFRCSPAFQFWQPSLLCWALCSTDRSMISLWRRSHLHLSWHVVKLHLCSKI